MAADPELLLTVNGVDVTGDVWNWSEVAWTDAWNQHPTLTFPLRVNFSRAAAFSVPPYADVRLVDLTNGFVMFEGVAGGSPYEERTEDPHWVVRTVTATGYGSLFDTAPLMRDVTWTVADPTLPASYPTTAALVAMLLDAAFRDRRVNTSVWDQTAADLPSPVVWGGRDMMPTTTWASGTMLGQALSQVAAQSDEYTGGAWGGNRVVVKLIPSAGLVVAVPASVPFGISSFAMTAAGDGVPASIVYTRDDSAVSSSAVVTGTPYGSRVLRDPGNGTSLTNGYNVSRGGADATAWYAQGLTDGQVSTLLGQEFAFGQWAPAAGFTLTSGNTSKDVRLGSYVAFDHPYWGSQGGPVHAVRTTFRDRVYDTAARPWPWFLDSGLLVDGSWSLDAAASQSIPRRQRVHTLSIASAGSAYPRSMVGSVRALGAR